MEAREGVRMRSRLRWPADTPSRARHWETNMDVRRQERCERRNWEMRNSRRQYGHGGLIVVAIVGCASVLQGAEDTALHYKWKSKWTLHMEGHGFHIKGDKITSPQGASVPFIGSDMILDLPGTHDVYIEADAKETTDYVCLTFTEACTVGIEKDGTITVDRAGVSAKDKSGKSWKSVAVGDGRNVFMPAQ